MKHVYWLGGGSGAGKSTVARRLADEHGLRLYDTDAAMADHAARSTPEDSPALHEFLAMDMAERWSDRSPEVMLETFHWYRGEGFDAGEPVTVPIRMFVDSHIAPLYHATVEATEAAIVNALLAAETTTGRNGATAHGLEPERLLEAMGRFGSR